MCGRKNETWNDVLVVLKVQGERLDLPYLRKTAESLDVAELLGEALEAVGVH